MFPLLKHAHGLRPLSFSDISCLIDRCLPSKSAILASIIHAQLIKVGLIRNTFLGNRCIDMYFRSGAVQDALKVFDDIPERNTFSWNVCLRGLLDNGDFGHARNMFDEMPERDFVSWNTIISGSASFGFSELAVRIFLDMQNSGVRPNEFTLSTLTSLVWCSRHGKQIHGNMICRGVSRSNLVVWNSLINLYGKLGLVDYAFTVFLSMEDWDIISWNSLILCFSMSGHEELALNQFHLMRAMGYMPDEYTVSAIISICSDLQNLDKGKQALALCIKMGFLSNSIVSGAAIDMFSKCNRLEDSVQLFEDIDCWDSALCNSIIASYSWHGFAGDALDLFVLALRNNVRPSGFTVSSLLSSFTILMHDHGSLIHSLIIKLGFESDAIVATSLMEMYNKIGLTESALKIFATTDARDLILWNTMIMGLGRNGEAAESLRIFHQLLKQGLKPDRVTFTGILLSCCYTGFVSKGIQIFSSMETEYSVGIHKEHYTCIVDLLCRTDMIDEALEIARNTTFEPSSLLWEPILKACLNLGDLKLTETVAKRMLESEPKSMLPYLALAKVYETMWRWEELVRIRYAMPKIGLKPVQESSEIGIKNKLYCFESDHMQIHGGDDTLAILKLLTREYEDLKAQFSARHEENGQLSI